MELENLNLDDFDIETFEPPNFRLNGDFTAVDYKNDEEYSSEDEEEEEDFEFQDETNDLEIDIIDDEGDFDENFDNVIYSYPFYSKDGIDYEYRITISEEDLILEQVKCDDNKVDFDESTQVFSEIFRGTLNEAFELITKNIDLRDKKTILQEGIIDYNFDNYKGDVDTLKRKIEGNKISVLFELYKEIIDSVYE
jgi:hypothetical protein